jgi:Ferritin-like
MPIADVDELKAHLQTAIELEHATIPPYLCALYSIPDGKNVSASALIRSVVMEEMLHMVLAANLLNAIGGRPNVNHQKFVPSYPTYLPHSDKRFVVELLPFGHQAIETFLKIEQPAAAGAKPEGDHYRTIGQFYEAIRDGFEYLVAKEKSTIFTGHRSRQIDGAKFYYGGGGKPIEVHDLETARKAIAEITEQGEGFDGTIFDGDNQFGQVDELAHFFRFNEIRAGRHYRPTDTPHRRPTGAELVVDWSARYPMAPNPKASEYADRPEIHALMVAFNRKYTTLLDTLHTAFNGTPETLMTAVPLMYELKYRAQALMAIPTGRDDGTTVGPSFEFTA